jgi:hypothetical protein
MTPVRAADPATRGTPPVHSILTCRSLFRFSPTEDDRGSRPGSPLFRPEPASRGFSPAGTPTSGQSGSPAGLLPS